MNASELNNLTEKIKNVRKTYNLLPKRQYDQFFATEETTIAKANLAFQKKALDGKNICLLGDDDLVSLALFLVGKPNLVQVVEIDKDITKVIYKESEKNNLNIKILERDVRDLQDNERTFSTFDTVITDPPYTPMGITLFINKALKFLKHGGGQTILLCYGASHNTPENFLKLQEILNSFNLVIEDKIDKFNKYYGAQSIGSQSSMYVLKTTGKTKPNSIYYNESDIYTYQIKHVPPFIYIENHSLRLFNVKSELCKKEKDISKIITDVANKLGLSIVAKDFIRFKGGGLTVNFTLNQSSLNVHTWPERGLVHLNLITCSPINNPKSIPLLFLKAFDTNIYEYKRLE